MMDDKMKDDSMMKKESTMMKPTGYISYDESKVSEALASGQKVALFSTRHGVRAVRHSMLLSTHHLHLSLQTLSS